MYIRNYNSRLYFVVFFFVAFLFCISARLVYIQTFRKQFLTNLANKQHKVYIELQPARGLIYDCNMKPQTANINLASLFAVPRIIPEKDKNKVASALSQILGIDQNSLLKKIKTKKGFVWIARKLTPDVVNKIKALKLSSLGFIREPRRSYPNRELAAHILGCAGLDNYGLEGVELAYEKYLKGIPGKALLVRDGTRKTLPIQDEYAIPPKDGYDVVLTIDESIQYIAERELEKVFVKYRAKGAAIIVMDPHTGRILALANRPTYDPNKVSAFNRDFRRNRAICDFFEPGSVFKIVAASAALEEKAYKESDVLFCENGAYKVGNHILHDHQPHGNLTFSEVIQKSSNIGVTKIAQRLGSEKIYKYIKLFGFSSISGFDLPGEVSGMLRAPNQWSKTSIGAIPIGQEVCVTALQLASALSVVANGGWLMKPYIVDRIQDATGEVIKEVKPNTVRRVISEDTAKRLANILSGVVETGTGKLAAVDGFKVAGKTGTAQKIEPNGAYSHSKYIASFIGFIPADKPELTIVVTVDEPKGYYFGGVVAAPVFKNVAEDSLRYFEVVPNITRKNEVAKAN